IYSIILQVINKVPMKNRYWKGAFSILFFYTCMSCIDFVEINPPDAEISGEVIFTRDETALAALDAIYHQLQYTGFSSGRTDGITIFCDTQSDILVNHSSTSTADHVISPNS